MITSGSNSRVKQMIQWQKSARERQEAGVFPAEGFKMFAEAPDEDLLETYVSESAWRRLEAVESTRQGLDPSGEIAAKLERVGYELVSDAILEKMSDTRTPQGIVFAVRQPRYTLEQLLAVTDPLFVLLEDIQDPGNLGTIVRTGEGAGITGVIICGNSADLYNPKTVRATMGSIFRVPCIYVDSAEPVICSLHEAGVQTYAAHLAGEILYDGGCSFRGGTAFLIGSEGRGLREETAWLAQHLVKIPMEGHVESLNAAVAASLLMYEAHRQRKG